MLVGLVLPDLSALLAYFSARLIPPSLSAAKTASSFKAEYLSLWL